MLLTAVITAGACFFDARSASKAGPANPKKVLYIVNVAFVSYSVNLQGLKAKNNYDCPARTINIGMSNTLLFDFTNPAQFSRWLEQITVLISYWHGRIIMRSLKSAM